jgi:hypothetical protein
VSAPKNRCRRYSSAIGTQTAPPSEAAFTAAVRQLGPTDNAAASWNSRNIENNNKATLRGVVITKQRTRIPLTIMLVKEEGAWKVLSLSGPKAGIELSSTLRRPRAKL